MTTTTTETFGKVIGLRTPFAGHAKVITGTDSAAEAVQAAGLDYTVSKRPLWFTGKNNGSKPVKVADEFGVVLDGENERLFGTVKKGYTIVQNAEAFTWAEGLGEFQFGGSMKHGGQIYLGVKLDRHPVMGGDAHDLYLVLWNGHDGKKSLGGMVTPIRLRCMNQLSFAKHQAISQFCSRHTLGVAKRTEDKLDNLLAMVDSHVAAIKARADKLAGITMSDERIKQVLQAAMPARTVLHSEILLNMKSTDTLDESQRHTAYGLLQATTEFFEWKRGAETRESALQSTFDGVGARTARALEAILLPQEVVS